MSRTLMLAGLIALLPALALAQSATITGANGRSATASTTRSDGSATTTVTGPDGRTATSTATRERTETGVTSSRTTTGPGGNTRTRESTTNVDRASGTATRETNVQRRDGSTGSRSGTFQRN